MNQESQSDILKVSSKYWRESVISSPVLIVILSVVFFSFKFQRVELLLGFLWLITIYNLWVNIKFATQSYIAYSPTTFAGRIGNTDFKLNWNEVKAVQFFHQAETRAYFICTENIIVSIRCNHFDEQAVRNILENHLRPYVFEELAYQDLINDLRLKNIAEAQFSNLPYPLKVSLDKSGIFVGTLFVIGSGVMSALLYSVNRLQTAWVFPFILFGLGVLLIISTGWLEATNEKISMYTRYHQYHFAWRDIREIYRVSAPGGIIALVGQNSQFIVPAELRWSGKDKAQLANFIDYKLAESKIEPMNGDRKIYTWRSKNAPE